MREIKFRAWDGEQMILLENSGLQYFDFEGSYSLGFTVDGYSAFWAHEQYREASDKASKFPIMQFIGLHDRNGKEIYEGDIVRVWHDRDDDDGFYTIGVVKYSPAEFYIIGDGYSITCHFHYNDSEREVIGNIYENPELLNG